MTLKALVVDDEPVARRKLKTLLESEPAVRVLGECEDGASAVDAIRRLRPDVVFLDVQMPGLDGFDVIDALDPREQPDIVFVTAYDRYAVRAFELHAVDYLLKPFERARLRKTIARLTTRADGRDASRRVHAAVDSVRAQQPLRRVLVKTSGRIYAVRRRHRFDRGGRSLPGSAHRIGDAPHSRIDRRARGPPGPCALRAGPPIVDRQRGPHPRASASVPRRVRHHLAQRPTAALQPHLLRKTDQGHVEVIICTVPCAHVRT